MLQLAAKDSSEVARINGYARDPHVAWYWSLKEAGSNAAVVAQLNDWFGVSQASTLRAVAVAVPDARLPDDAAAGRAGGSTVAVSHR